MFLSDILVVLAIVLFLAAVAIELRKDRDKKMYVGREAKSGTNPANLPVEKPAIENSERSLPVVTQEEFKQRDFKQTKKSA